MLRYLDMKIGEEPDLGGETSGGPNVRAVVDSPRCHMEMLGVSFYERGFRNSLKMRNVEREL